MGSLNLQRKIREVRGRAEESIEVVGSKFPKGRSWNFLISMKSRVRQWGGMTQCPWLK